MIRRQRVQLFRGSQETGLSRKCASVGKRSNAMDPQFSASGYKRRFNVLRLKSASACIADAIGQKADIAWVFAARAEIYAACTGALRSFCNPEGPFAAELFDEKLT